MNPEIIDFISVAVRKVGYLGIFLGMFLESTIIPIPSELVMVPAGIAASKGQMSFTLIMVFGVAGNVLGAVASYYLALIYGKKFIEKFGKFIFVKPSALQKVDDFFVKYGAISVFMGRLLPGFRHFISIPAGIGEMEIKKFTIYTLIGSTIWDFVLTSTGYFIGENHQLISEKLNHILVLITAATIVLLGFYIFRKPARK